MSARPYRLLSETALRGVEARVSQWLRCWSEEWAIEPSCLLPAVERLEAASAPDLAEGWSRLDTSGWTRVTGDLAQAVHRVLYGESSLQADSVAGHCAVASAESLLQGLRGLLAEAPSAPDAGARAQVRPGQGWMLVTVSLESATVRLAAPADRLLPTAAPRHHDRPRPDPAALADALRSVGTACTVELGCAELALGELVELKPGDVIVLDRSIHQPLLAHLPGGEAALEVHLGRHDNRYAVQVLGTNRP